MTYLLLRRLFWSQIKLKNLCVILMLVLEKNNNGRRRSYKEVYLDARLEIVEVEILIVRSSLAFLGVII